MLWEYIHLKGMKLVAIFYKHKHAIHFRPAPRMSLLNIMNHILILHGFVQNKCPYCKSAGESFSLSKWPNVGQTHVIVLVTMVIHPIKSQKLLGHITPPFQGCSSHPRYIGGKWVDNKKAKLEYFPKKVATSQHDSTLNIFP